MSDQIPLGWHTDLAVLRLGSSTVEEHDDHLVVRTPSNPSYYWGNFVLVTDAGAVDQAARWLARFEELFPDAQHRAVGLVADTGDDQAWLDQTLFIERADVLVARGAVATTTLAEGYEVRELATADDWEQSTRMRALAFPGQDEYEQSTTETRIEVVAGGDLTWFGAFLDGRLAAELGTARCGDGVARYQSVLTHPDHRRRGLTSHLLGVAADHARDRGDGTLVIIADADTDAGRLYRRAGFALDSTEVQASRVPGIEVG